MKNKKLILSLVAALVAVVAIFWGISSLSNSADTKSESTKKTTITVATGGAPAPFSFTDKDGKITGQNIDLV